MAEEKGTKAEVVEVKAFARRVHVSPRKARLVVDLLRNMPVDEALVQLDFLSKKAVLPIKKLLHSAVANASHNFQIESERLFIKHFSVDGGRVFFRYTPRAQGRAMPVRKRTSHLNLILGVSKTKLSAKRKPFLAAAKVETKTDAKREAQIEQAERQEPEPKMEAPVKKSRFAFWRKKDKAGTGSQVPPKEDTKGKHYTGFDRRGSM
jgi:large subunit ribosomal protein L22